MIDPPSLWCASFSAGKGPGHSSSGNTNHGTSSSIPFNFPRGEVQVEGSDEGVMSSEGTWLSIENTIHRLSLILITVAKHETPLKVQGCHYSNEAEVTGVCTCTFS